MKIAVEGCCHGELDKIYETVAELERQNGFKVDLLIICGDFQAVRNFDDLQAMAVPAKYQQLNTFYKYYNREKVAPLLTVFIGGNHEASNYMQELPYGGWVAPNIYYMGYAGIIQIGGLRIGGISGIFKGHDFNRGHHERPPYTDETKRSVYHVRNLEVFRLKQISRHVDVFISHDWPKGIYHHGDATTLIKIKPFFQREIEENKLGSGPLSDLLSHLKPAYWFAAHLHVKFAAHVQHQPQNGSGPAKCTKFLALDKCLPRRNFLQVMDLPHDQKEGLKIKLDPEWMSILRSTDHLLNLTSSNIYMPGQGCGQRFDFRVTDKEIGEIVKTFGGDMSLPENFVHTSPPIVGHPGAASRQRKQPLTVQVNPQTTLLCTMLDITDPNAKFLGRTSQELLDESSIGLDVLDGSGDDVVNDSSDEDDMPSSVNSSMDVSASIGSTFDSYDTANETLDSSQKLSLVTSTPAKGSSSEHVSLNVEVDDNDDEFISILSAQKSKSFNMSTQPLSTPSLADGGCISPALPCHRNGSVSHSDLVKDALPDKLVPGVTVINEKINGGTDIIQSISTSKGGLLSSFSSGDDNNVSTVDHQSTKIKPERTSFGLSGLCLDSSKTSSFCSDSSQSSSLALDSSQTPSLMGQDGTSPLLNKKRDSLNDNASAGSTVLTEGGSAVKKLKRRNMSLYSEPLD